MKFNQRRDISMTSKKNLLTGLMALSAFFSISNLSFADEPFSLSANVTNGTSSQIINKSFASVQSVVNYFDYNSL